MTAKPVNERRRAKQDVQDAVDHYLGQGAPGAARTFVQALEAAYRLISAHPSSGSPSYVERFGGPPRLRGWALKGVPYVVFYLECADRIDVVRVLHGRRDIPALMRER